MSKKDMWNKLLQLGISEDVIEIIVDIYGYTEDTLCSILRTNTIYGSFEQITE